MKADASVGLYAENHLEHLNLSYFYSDPKINIRVIKVKFHQTIYEKLFTFFEPSLLLAASSSISLPPSPGSA